MLYRFFAVAQNDIGHKDKAEGDGGAAPEIQAFQQTRFTQVLFCAEASVVSEAQSRSEVQNKTGTAKTG
ncbi:hypothetical protein IJT93_12820 [bacterium]|nr:hypothetical protein [bacterium]